MVEALDPGHRITPGADKGYDTKDFVAAMRRQGVTPHVAQNTKGRRSAIDRRTTRHRGTARVGLPAAAPELGPGLFERSVKVVAGAGFEPAAFRL